MHPVILLGVVVNLVLPVAFVLRTRRAEARANDVYAEVARLVEREDPPPPTAG